MDKEFLEQFFAYEHLPVHLQDISKPFGELASKIVAELPKNPERTTALRKLLEEKEPVYFDVAAERLSHSQAAGTTSDSSQSPASRGRQTPGR